MTIEQTVDIQTANDAWRQWNNHGNPTAKAGLITIAVIAARIAREAGERENERLRAEIEELKNRLSVLDEFRVSSQNTLIAANEAHVGEMRAEIERLNTENDSLRTVLSDWTECASVDVTMEGPRIMGWNRSALDRCLTNTATALQPKEGE